MLFILADRFMKNMDSKVFIMEWNFLYYNVKLACYHSDQRMKNHYTNHTGMLNLRIRKNIIRLCVMLKILSKFATNYEYESLQIFPDSFFVDDIHQ